MLQQVLQVRDRYAAGMVSARRRAVARGQPHAGSCELSSGAAACNNARAQMALAA
jgi:hypothetical protein